MVKRALVLLSGGIDSATCLYLAKRNGFIPYCLIFDYGQSHRKEIESAKRIAKKARAEYKVCKIDLANRGCSLLERSRKIPQRGKGIPSTYVPGRNIIFLSFALSYAETIKAKAIFIGSNARDFSGYPDCRPNFYRAFKNMAKAGLKNGDIHILTPLIHKTKPQIVKLGQRLGVPYELSWSCYRGGKRPCQACDSCRFRAKGFRGARVQDPLL